MRWPAVLAAVVVAVAVAPAPAGSVPATGRAERVLGGTGSGDARLIAMNPSDIAVGDDELYIASTDNSVVHRVDLETHVATVLAGNGTMPPTVGGSYSTRAGNGGPAAQAQVSATAVAADAAGNVYVGDGDVVRRVSGGTITAWTGGSTVLDGGRTTTSRTGRVSLDGVLDLDVDPAGNLNIAGDTSNALGFVRRVRPDGTVAFVAGGLDQHAPVTDGGAATAVPLVNLMCVGHDASGATLVCANDRVRRIGPDGKITTVAGSGVFTAAGSGDGGPATAAKLSPTDVALAPNGDLLVADWYNRSIRRVSGGTITSLPALPPTNYGFFHPNSVAVDASGRVYAAMQEAGVVLRLEGGTWEVFAGAGGGFDLTAQGTTAASTQTGAFRLERGPDGTLYLGESSRIRRVAPGGAIDVVWGPDDGYDAMAVGPDGRLLVVSQGRLWRREAAGTWTDIAAAPNALSLAVMPNGDALVGPFDGAKVFRITMAGVTTTFAGTGTSGFSGDGGQATAAKIDQASAIGVDSAGNVWIATNSRVRRVGTNGVITTVAGNGTSGEGQPPDGATATATWLPSVYDLEPTPDGSSVYLAVDPFGGRNAVRRLSGGKLTTVAGGATSTNGIVTGRPAVTVEIMSAYSLEVEPDGNLLVLDAHNGDFRGEASDVLRVAPVAASTPLASAPGTPSVTAAGTRSVSFGWAAPTSQAASVVAYRVRLELPYGGVQDFDTPTAATSFTLPVRLAPSVVKVRVAALTGAGQGPFSAAATFAAPFRSAADAVKRHFPDFANRAPTTAELFEHTANTLIYAEGATSSAAVLFGAADDLIAPVTRLYSAYFLRPPDTSGLSYWVGRRRAGVPLADVSSSFAASAEFKNRYGSKTNSQFVTLVYQNVLGRAPDSAGQAFWTNKLNAGMSRGAVMTNFSESTEYENKTRPVTMLTTAVFCMLRRAPTAAEVERAKVGGTVPEWVVLRDVASTDEYDARV